MKILIIRLSSIGDIVLCSPVVRCLKEQKPDIELHFLTKKGFASVLSNNPYIDKVHYFENYKKTLSGLKSEYFDEIIDLHNNQRTFIIKKKLGIPSYSFQKLNLKKWLLCNLKINLLPKIHIVDRYLETVKHLGVVNDQKGLDYFLAGDDKIDLKSISEELNPANFIAWVIGGQHKGKIFPAEKIIKIANSTQLKIVLMGGPDDKKMGHRIESQTKNVTNTCGKYSLNQSADILRQSKLVITNDTGLMHIAAAFKKKIISLWGGTTPDFGMYPYLPDVKSKMIIGKSFLSPSSKLGKTTLLNPNPMGSIDIKEVENAIDELL